MRRFITRNYNRVTFVILFLLIFLVFKNIKIDNVEETEVRYTREQGTASEEKAREERRVNLQSILFEGISPQNSDNIYFILSTTTDDRFIPRYVSYRQVCSIESALRAYPENLIYVIFLSYASDVAFHISKSLYGLSYRNIILTKLNIGDFLASVAPNFRHHELLSSSKYQYKHTLDMIRLILLFKYGGTFIDDEMIVRKNISHVKNFLCDEGFYSIIDTVMGFDQPSLVEILIEDLIKNFDGTIENHQGSILLTRVMERLCQSPRVKMKMDRRDCEGFNILNKEACYPIDSNSYWKLFDASQKEIALAMISNSSIVHLFNPLSKGILKSVDTAATQLMQDFCPNTFGLAEEMDFVDFS